MIGTYNSKQKQATIASIGTGPYVRVEVDSRDESKDRVMTRSGAHARYQLGHLSFDCTNGLYCVPDNGKLPSWMDNQTAPLYATCGFFVSK